ncbi:MAG: ISL3 family transposase [Armatimonadota bacterium]
MPFQSISRALGLQGWVVEQIDFHGPDQLRLRVESTSPWHRCRRCGSRTTKAYDHRVRVLRDLSVFGRQVYLYVPQWRVDCPVCRAIVSEELDLCEPGQMMTRRYEHYLAKLCELLPAQAVARWEGLSWSTVAHIDRKYLEKRQQAQRLEDVRQICIDEVAYKKGQNYVTVVSDLISRKVLWVGKDRSKATVAAFFAELGPAATAAIEVVAMDMSAAYIAAVTESAPQALIVYDRFHIMKYVHEAVDQVRRDEQAAADTQGKTTLKNKRWVLLKREKNLKVKERTKLAELLALNAKLAKSYILKEDFTLFFECRDLDSAVQFLDGWIKRAKESQLQPFLHLVQQLQRWRFNLLNYFITPVSNGLAEAINNHINVIKRTAYGFRDVEFFMLKILQRCGNLPPLAQVLQPCQ